MGKITALSEAEACATASADTATPEDWQQLADTMVEEYNEILVEATKHVNEPDPYKDLEESTEKEHHNWGQEPVPDDCDESMDEHAILQERLEAFPDSVPPPTHA
jgi:hypothetical protein